MPANYFNHSEANFDFIAIGLMQIQSNEYTIITYQLPLLDHDEIFQLIQCKADLDK
jgi:hypothetical protein